MDEAIALQEDASLEIVTDGEMRRLSFQGQMTDAVDGFGEHDIDAFLWGEWHGDKDVGEWKKKRPETIGVIGKLTRKRHLSAEEFTYLRSHTSCVPRVIVKSGVLAIDSSGGLIDVCHFDSIVEFHSSNHLGQIIESS